MHVIDSDNYKAAGIEALVFPGGEPHIKVPFFTEPLLLHLKLRNWLDVGHAALLLDAMKRQPRNVRTEAFIPYFPGARQDRTDGRAALTAEVMASLLGVGIPVTFFDPHSHVAENLMIRRGPINTMMPSELGLTVNAVGVIVPDAGATARASGFRDGLLPDALLVPCAKKRDSQTGALSGYEMARLPKAGRYIIVDDICDGGGTFNLLAKAFRDDPLASYCSLEMFVSHGIFSKGLDAIDPIIEHITTTDSWCCLAPSSRLTVVPLLPHLLKRLGVSNA